MDCGRNENQHFNPDNFIAQPGVRNGAEHLHDYVGNLSTNADSTNESLVEGRHHLQERRQVRLLLARRPHRHRRRERKPARQGSRDRDAARRTRRARQVDCPDVASKLPDVPDQAMDEVNRNLDLLDTQIDEANTRIANGDLKSPQDVQNAVVGPLKDKRAATLDRIAIAIGRTRREADEPGRARGVRAQAERQGRPRQRRREQQRPARRAAGRQRQQRDRRQRRRNPARRSARPRSPAAARGRSCDAAVPAILYGDAKQSTNGPANARPSWTCSGFEDRLTDNYPICPEGSKVERIHAFPNCWDGKNIDSANHRTHIVFSDQQGRCPQGFKNVPQLGSRWSTTSRATSRSTASTKWTPSRRRSHNPRSDHDDFANVMGQRLMNQVVSCINSGKRCPQ